MVSQFVAAPIAWDVEFDLESGADLTAPVVGWTVTPTEDGNYTVRTLIIGKAGAPEPLADAMQRLGALRARLVRV